MFALDPKPSITTLRVSAFLNGGAANAVRGFVNMSQASTGGPVTISVSLSGVNASTTGSPVQHGFHVHAVSNIGNACADAGGHLNVRNVTHGAPNNATDKRHTGDLGNLVSDAAGNIFVTFTDRVISLRANDATNVADKPIVLHRDYDDLGLGGNPASLLTGNSGPRLACGILTRV